MPLTLNTTLLGKRGAMRFFKMTREAGIGHWHAREGRHTDVSITSSNGVPIQEISDAADHKSTHVTETVYRHVIVHAIRSGAIVMDSIFDYADSSDANFPVGPIQPPGRPPPVPIVMSKVAVVETTSE